MINDQAGASKKPGLNAGGSYRFLQRASNRSGIFLRRGRKESARHCRLLDQKSERKRAFFFLQSHTEQLYQRIKEGVKECNVIIKADVQGSIEAISDALNKLSTDDIKLRIIHSSTGAISETDVMLASLHRQLLSINVRPDARVVDLAQQEGVEIKLYDIIYNVIADVRAAMEGLLEPEYKEVVQGRAEVRELFKVPKVALLQDVM